MAEHRRRRRASSFGACLPLFVAPFLLASFIMSWIVYGQLRTLRGLVDRPLRTSMQGPDGPVRLTGTLRAQPRPGHPSEGAAMAPSGNVGALWAYKVHRRVNKTHETLCEHVSLEEARHVELLLGEGDSAAPVSLDALLANTYVWTEIGTLKRGGAQVHIRTAEGSYVTTLPTSLPQDCVPSDPRNTSYTESRIREGERVTVLACAREGALVPCADGVDAISSAPLAELSRELVGEWPGIEFVVAWNSICWLLLGILLTVLMPNVPGVKLTVRRPEEP